jgi:hypothetical protein
MRWVQGSLVTAVALADKFDLMLVDPPSGRTRTVKIGREFWEFSFVGPTSDGRLFVALGRNPGAGVREATEYGIFRLDVDRGRIEGQPLLRDTGRPWTAGVRLSPSGRYWMRDGDAQEGESRRVLDIVSGGEVLPAVPRGAGARWLADDRLVWLESDGTRSWLMLASPGHDAEVLRFWERGSLSIEVSPDRGKLLAVVIGGAPAGPARRVAAAPTVSPERVGTFPEASVFDSAAGGWTKLALPDLTKHAAGPETFPPLAAASWAGPDTVVFTSGRRLWFTRGTSCFPLE